MATISASPGSVAGSLSGSLTLPVVPPSWRRPMQDCGVPTVGDVSAPEADEIRAARKLLAAGIIVFLLALGLSGLMAKAGSRVAAGLTPHATSAQVAESAALPAWTVSSGDTLWTIAVASDPESDPRATVAELREVNGLPASHVLQIGEVLQLPGD